ncbi:hypothetical protein F2P56_023489 [Juglans regia]|uniref:Zinc knuckle CX2CX4HX4C domain-containing protein n=2 Tax=Juglans regia TaxID=51240 RepID=A0A833U5P6_JUGRE|nr:uncharacterized protein LOC108980527 [Juglans regia]KAF5453769.1 hypothetical protein F2P56_023489 [Juglans regia]
MAEELSNLYEELCITEEEKQEVLIPTEEALISIEKSKKCLAAHVVADKEVNRGALRTTMSKVWKVEGQVSFKELGCNKFLVEFQNPLEKNRVLSERPWSFDRYLICLFNCEDCLAPRDIFFNEEPFWVQLHDLPFAGMNRTMGERLGAAAGNVVLVDVDSSGMAWGSFLRVKLILDISKPLTSGRFINLGGKRYWIPFKYERLPLICFHCGAIKHAGLSCPSGNQREGVAPQYGSWLRANSQHRSFQHFSKKRGGIRTLKQLAPK